MTHCRTGCGAEINYKAVHFSSPVVWYDIPMEGDVIHDCPKLKPAPNDDANEHLKNLESMHVMLHDHILYDMQYDYGSYIQNFVDLPHDLKMHSKGKLAARAWAGAGPHVDMCREDYDKLPKSRKEELKNTYGFEPPASTPEERIADFRADINHAMSFLQRCTDRFPAPFYRYGEYSQLELFRIFLESIEQYADAIICHTIQVAIDTSTSQVDVETYRKGVYRLQKKLEDQRLAKAYAEAEYQIAEKKRLVRQGMDEEEVQYELDMHQQEEEHYERLDEKYPTSIMNWALDLFQKEIDKKQIELNKQDDALEHRGEQIEVSDTVVKEQSVEELLKPHSQEVFGPLHSYIRKYILYLYDDDEKELWDEFPDILTQIRGTKDEMTKKTLGGTRNRQKSSTYPMVDESDLGHATFGQLDVILSRLEIKLRKDKDGNSKAQIYTKAGKKAKKKAVIEHDEYALLLKVVKLAARNPLDHENTRKELPQDRKMLLVAAASILMTMMDKMKYR